jgi:hypothetical protein
MSVNAYLLPKRADNIPTTQKGFTIRKVVVTNEVLLQGGDGYDSEGRPYLASQKNIDISNAYIYQEDDNVLNLTSLPITDESGNPIQP